MFTHIFWDFDGTLFDTYPVMAETCRRVLYKAGKDVTQDEIMAQMKISMPYAIQYFKTHYGIDDDTVAAYKREVKPDERLYAKPFEGIPEILKAICASDKKNYLYTHRGDSSFELLRKFGLYDYFADFITAGDGFARKPSPDALLYLLRKHRIPCEEALMIGDRDLDIQAAKNAGMSGCYFDQGASNDNPLADFTIRNHEMLRQILEMEG